MIKKIEKDNQTIQHIDFEDLPVHSAFKYKGNVLVKFRDKYDGCNCFSLGPINKGDLDEMLRETTVSPIEIDITWRYV
jgi:hypothetical protein